MQQDWLDFLHAPHSDTSMENSPNAGENYRADLSPLAPISVRGADAASFLQAQFSNDVMRLGESASQIASWCDAKGRVLAVIRIFRSDDAYVLLVPAELLETLLKRLKMFVLRAKVELSDASDALQRFALFGPQANKLLNELGTAPDVDGVTVIQQVQCLRLPGDIPSYICIGSLDVCKKLWNDLRDKTDSVPHETWQLCQILAGQSQVFTATQGEFVPQMLNLHWLSGIDFQKGCYPGQEVVARLQYRGTLKRRMFLAELNADSTPQPGAVVTDSAGANIGQVVMAAPRSHDTQALLAVLKINAAEGAQIEGQMLELQTLPYSTPD